METNSAGQIMNEPMTMIKINPSDWTVVETLNSHGKDNMIVGVESALRWASTTHQLNRFTTGSIVQRRRLIARALTSYHNHRSKLPGADEITVPEYCNQYYNATVEEFVERIIRTEVDGSAIAIDATLGELLYDAILTSTKSKTQHWHRQHPLQFANDTELANLVIPSTAEQVIEFNSVNGQVNRWIRSSNISPGTGTQSLKKRKRKKLAVAPLGRITNFFLRDPKDSRERPAKYHRQLAEISPLQDVDDDIHELHGDSSGGSSNESGSRKRSSQGEEHQDRPVKSHRQQTESISSQFEDNGTHELPTRDSGGSSSGSNSSSSSSSSCNRKRFSQGEGRQGPEKKQRTLHWYVQNKPDKWRGENSKVP